MEEAGRFHLSIAHGDFTASLGGRLWRCIVPMPPLPARVQSGRIPSRSGIVSTDLCSHSSGRREESF